MYLVKFTEDGLAEVKALPKSTRNSLRRKMKDALARDPYEAAEKPYSLKAVPRDLRKLLKSGTGFSLWEHFSSPEKRFSAAPYGCSMELCEPLKRWRSFHWEKYRIVFRIYDELRTIAIAGIGERLPRSQSDVYRRLETLAREGKLAEKVLATLREFCVPPQKRS